VAVSLYAVRTQIL